MIRLSIKRPVTITMIYLVITALGVMAWQKIPIEQLPNTNTPRLSVGASYAASAEVVEALVTAPLEAEIQQVLGVQKVTSNSREGSATISIEFERDTDMEYARLELVERLSAIRERLPENVRPSVSRFIPPEFREATLPLLDYRVSGPYILEALRDQIERHVQPVVEAIDGVSGMSVNGGADRIIRIDLDQEKLTAFGLNANAVTSAISALEYIDDVGTVESGGIRQALVIREAVDSIPNILDLVVASNGTRVIRVSDVGRVVDTFEEQTNYSRVNGFPAITFSIQQQARVNTVALADTVKKVVASLQPMLMQGIRMEMQRDQSEIIKQNLHELRNRALFAAVSIFVVLLIFLRSLRSTLIIFATIAFASLIALNLMYFAGHTLNVLTLTGLAMGFGMVVDNAIVVLENIFRRWRSGDTPDLAAERGSREVVLALMAATATTVVVFIPFMYLQGDLRLYYLPLAIVVGFSLLASQFVAFSFIPALATKLLAASGFRGQRSKGEKVQADSHATETEEYDSTIELAVRPDPTRKPVLAGRPKYVRLYVGLIAFILRWPWVAVVVAVAMLGGSYNLFNKYVSRGSVWSPSRQARSTVRISMTFPQGEELARTDQVAQFFEYHLKTIDEVESFETRVSSTSLSITVYFPDSLEYTYAPHMVYEDLATVGTTFAGPRFGVYAEGKSFNTGGGVSSIGGQRINVYGYNFRKVQEISDDIARRLLNQARVQNVDANGTRSTGLGTTAIEIVVAFDRERLGLYGLTVREAASAVQAATRGNGNAGSSVLKIGGDEIRFTGKIEGFTNMDMNELQDLMISGGNRTSPVRLRDVAYVFDRPVLSGITRENQQYNRYVSYEFRGPQKLADRIRQGIVDATQVPEGYRVLASAPTSLRVDERKQIYGVLALSLVLVFMVTAALFESIRQPMCVLLTVPMALIGVFLMFFYVGATFTREAYIGVIIMGGIVVNNAILLIDRINRLRRNEGWLLRPAIVQGALDRVRPILMTTAVTIVGLLPLVMFGGAAGANRNIWNALAYALMGGLTSSTLLVLTITPALYLLFEWRPEKRRLRRIAIEDEEAAAAAGPGSPPALPAT